ncbi:MAG TPA: hypothetical protein PKH07_12295, partial [bacterium]|nr:hypothetical protein [bacterium]
LLLNENLGVEFANRFVCDLCGNSPREITPEIMLPLGIEAIEHKELMDTIRSVFSSRIGKLTLIPISAGKQIILAQMSLVMNKEQVRRVLMMIGSGR